MQNDDNRGHMWPLSVYNADSQLVIEDTTEWASESPDRLDLQYLASQLDEDSESWVRFRVDVEQDDPFTQVWRLDLRAASKAGE